MCRYAKAIRQLSPEGLAVGTIGEEEAPIDLHTHLPFNICTALFSSLISVFSFLTIYDFQVLRHEFRSDQLTDAHKESSLRLATSLEEQKALTASWDLERYVRPDF